MLRLWLLAAGLSCAPAAGGHAGTPVIGESGSGSLPFGFEAGSDPARSPDCKRLGPDPRYWSCTRAPAPDPEFDGYVVIRDPAIGLCGLGAFAELGPDDDGARSRARAVGIAGGLSDRYGPPETVEDGLVAPDEVLERPGFFMFGIFHDLRRWKRSWRPPEGGLWTTVTLSVVSRERREGRYHGAVYLAFDNERCG